MDAYSYQDIAEALEFIPADNPLPKHSNRDGWVAIAAAIKSEFPDGFELFDKWSSGGASYSQKECRNVWRTLKPKKSTVGTIIKVARDNGWQQREIEEQERRRLAKEQAERKAAAAKQQQQDAADEQRWHEVVAQAAQTIWAGAAASGASDYLTKKKVQAHGLRFPASGFLLLTHDDFRTEFIHGRDAIAAFFATHPDERPSFKHIKRGAVFVPMCDVGGKIWNLQILWPSGKKSFLKHGRKQGTFHGLGSPKPEGPLLLAEGYATAATIYEATGHAVAAAFDAGNLMPVAIALRERYPNAEMAVCADDDSETPGNPGVRMGREVADRVGATLIVPKFEPADAAEPSPTKGGRGGKG